MHHPDVAASLCMVLHFTPQSSSIEFPKQPPYQDTMLVVAVLKNLINTFRNVTIKHGQPKGQVISSIASRLHSSLKRYHEAEPIVQWHRNLAPTLELLRQTASSCVQ